MSLRRVKRIYVDCDVCEQDYSMGGGESETWAELLAQIRSHGWQIGKLGVYCPACRERWTRSQLLAVSAKRSEQISKRSEV